MLEYAIAYICQDSASQESFLYYFSCRFIANLIIIYDVTIELKF